MFLCRDKELESLNQKYKGNNFELIVMYGRRRVGKTALLREFCKDKPTIFFSALDATSEENLQVLSRSIAACEGVLEDEGSVYASYDGALKKITRLGSTERIVFVIDEYPYLAKSEPSISSRLQHLIDHQWQDSKLFIILCGSSMNFMANQVLGDKSPLYGRRTAQYKILPLDYLDTATFYPQAALEDKAMIYGITGGIPLYILRLKYYTNIKESLCNNMFELASFLFEEPNNLLKQELREPALYNSIIGAIATGHSRLNDIAMKTALSSGVCSKYLDVLIELGIVYKETPITEKMGKKTIYYLADNYFRFWYRFIPKALPAINMGIMEEYYDVNIAPQLSNYMGLVFERMCKTYLAKQAKNGLYLTEIGQWWGSDAKTKKQVQIDIVATTLQEGVFLIGSCKYKNEEIGVDEFELLKQYAQVFGKGTKYIYYIFSKGGFKENLLELGRQGEVNLVTLQELYEK